MTSPEGWGAFIVLMLLVWSTDIIDWISDKIEERFDPSAHWRRRHHSTIHAFTLGSSAHPTGRAGRLDLSQKFAFAHTQGAAFIFGQF